MSPMAGPRRSAGSRSSGKAGKTARATSTKATRAKPRKVVRARKKKAAGRVPAQVAGKPAKPRTKTTAGRAAGRKGGPPARAVPAARKRVASKVPLPTVDAVTKRQIPGHRVLFVDVGNSARSIMAAAIGRSLGLACDSAGTMPAHELHSGAVLALKEKGIGVDGLTPHHVEFVELSKYDRVVAMGPGVRATDPGLPVHENWEIPDPIGRSYQTMREVRDAIERKVKVLAREMREWSGMDANDES